MKLLSNGDAYMKIYFEDGELANLKGLPVMPD